MNRIGKWAFVAGLALCLVVALIWELAAFVWVLVVLGIVVGLLNVRDDEIQRFLLAAVAIAVAGSGLDEIPYLGGWLQRTFQYFVVFMGPAAVVVAIRSVFATAKD